MRFVMTSDLHGDLPTVVPDGDFLLIAGDITPGARQPDQEVNWFNQRFLPWLDALPHRNKVFIAGNHDFALEKRLAHLDIAGHAVYLQDTSAVFDGVKIHGSPWSLLFGDWAFMRSEQDLERYWSAIPDDTQILLVHGPPLGYHDRCQSFGGTESVGSSGLLRRLRELKRLKLCQFGHIHEGYGMTLDNAVYFVNSSHYDGNFLPKNPPVVLDLEF